MARACSAFLMRAGLTCAGSNGAPETPYRLVTTEGVSTVEVEGRTFLRVEPEAIRRAGEALGPRTPLRLVLAPQNPLPAGAVVADDHLAGCLARGRR